MVIYPEEICYLQVQPGDARRLSPRPYMEEEDCRGYFMPIPPQARRRFMNLKYPSTRIRSGLFSAINIKIDPKSIDDYIAVDGYSALVKALFQSSPEQVVDMVKSFRPERQRRRWIFYGEKVGICPQYARRDKVCDRQCR